MNEKQCDGRRFVVDSMLGKMAKWLRILGFDTIYKRLAEHDQIRLYQDTGRLVVTRNRRWCNIPGVVCIEANDPEEQLKELITRIRIDHREFRLFHRCILCNETLEHLPRTSAFGRVPDYVYENQESFYECARCERVYWRGSHWNRMTEHLRQVLTGFQDEVLKREGG